MFWNLLGAVSLGDFGKYSFGVSQLSARENLRDTPPQNKTNNITIEVAKSERARSEPLDNSLKRVKKERPFRYIISSDIGFALGFNGREFIDLAQRKIAKISSVYMSGDNMRYGFSGAFNVGMFWTLPARGANVNSQKKQSKWSLGFQLRNMLSAGITSIIYQEHNRLQNDFYSQQDIHAFYALQPAFAGSYMLSALWGLQFYMGPSLNINFYRKSIEESVLDKKKQITQKIDTQDSARLDVFSLGAVAGLSLSYYFDSLVAIGAGTQFTLNISPHRGPNAYKYNIGQLLFSLHLQFSL